MSAEVSRNLCGLGDPLRVFESVLRLVKSCVFRPLDRRQASGHTLRCVR